jgi:DNA-binding CsgD family transcriptional regulator
VIIKKAGEKTAKKNTNGGNERMVGFMDKKEVIRLKEQGLSNRATARETGIDRKTVSKYWREYQENIAKLTEKEEKTDVRAIQEKICAAPEYNGGVKRKGGRTKYTEELDKRLNEIVREEKRKEHILGANHKQRLTNRQIHEKLTAEGFDISEATINIELARIRKRVKEVYIRQEYDLGDRLEYDFGEVHLDCGEGVKVYHMAVLSSPGGDFRWLYLYTNQKKAVFMDSHVRFFEMMGGSYKEVVYDNMRNVVTKFIGKNEKELNGELIKMSMYYGFEINVTNCFKGNEKGHVESSVKILRNRLFADKWTFASLEAAQEYAESRLLKMNENSAALKSIPRLKAVFDTHYSKQPKKFIETFMEHKDLGIDEIIALFQRETANKGEIKALDVVKPITRVDISARAFVANYAALMTGGENV